jgi:hypothetical protein
MLAVNLLPECYAFNKLHGDEVRPLALTNLVNVRDVRMVESGRGRGLLFETAHSILVSSHFGGKNLQRDFAMESQILRQINFTHPALADLGNGAVMGQGCIGCQFFIHLLECGADFYIEKQTDACERHRWLSLTG